jgi:hypothetical protein
VQFSDIEAGKYYATADGLWKTGYSRKEGVTRLLINVKWSMDSRCGLGQIYNGILRSTVY